MIKPYDLLNGVLHDIENWLKKGVNENTLAKEYFISNIYLRKLFKFAFGLPIGSYIRSRKLSSSIEDLLYTDRNIQTEIFRILLWTTVLIMNNPI
jgi:AraC family transcriptional regulator